MVTRLQDQRPTDRKNTLLFRFHVIRFDPFRPHTPPAANESAFSNDFVSAERVHLAKVSKKTPNAVDETHAISLLVTQFGTLKLALMTIRYKNFLKN